MCEKKKINYTLQNEFLTKLQNVLKLLDEIENDISNNLNNISNVDKKVSDCLHLIENYELADKSCVSLCKQLSNLREERRNYNNIRLLGECWTKYIEHLKSQGSRTLLRQYIGKTVKALTESDYKERVMTDEEKKLLLYDEETMDTHKGKKRLTKYQIDTIMHAFKNGIKVKNISKMTGIKTGTIYAVIKRVESK